MAAEPRGARRDDVGLELLLAAVAAGHPQTMVAHGRSMVPLIPPGTRVRLEAPSGPLELGQVVAVLSHEGRFFIHRLVGLRNDGRYLIKGDACRSPDGWVEREEIKAVVGEIEIGGRWERLRHRRLRFKEQQRRTPGIRR